MNLYSDRRLVTGFATAALMDWKLMVTMVMIIAAKPAKINIKGLIEILYSYFCSQPFKKYRATGDAIKQLNNTSSMKSFDSNIHTCGIDAPNTLRIPISLVLCSAV